MKNLLLAACPLLMILCLGSTAVAATQGVSSGDFTVLRTLPAREATQGVANDRQFLYAVQNSSIGKYDRETGKRVGGWSGDPTVFIHINSCQVRGKDLVCAMSNYPNVPMWSSVEWFDTATMTHVRTHSFGPGRGSLTWIDWHDGNWWACFANYDGDGGEAPRDHRATVLVRMDENFVPQEQWLFPEDVLERFGHHSASGGRWGRDGRLYVTGHDAPELYVLELPSAGGRLQHVATYRLPTHGQAFDWDAVDDSRLWTIDRESQTLVTSQLAAPRAHLSQGK
ncbi:hypothetical protein [Gluconobacter kanchanaburiensis]|uniref:Lipoprotein n=1 Tax=Gluconobacter kanchanaburiensis NBRC 103587 TaxID=1307948 RepID=A0A511BA16_9PROT|nr:hypothetical protein [Gluconobacter kanchanaburiensis]GEK97269.1 hypothetical protein GKA01_24660 [Gluconobacter kanchanaburiensis NBRC 103587]